jgi:hypothetical protein
MTITIPSSVASYTLSASGTIASNAGSRGQHVAGQPLGIYIQGSNDTLVNTGTIIGGYASSGLGIVAGVGVNTATGDSVTNQSGGLIQDTYTFAAGIIFYTTAGSVTNAGTIIGGIGVPGESGNGIDLDGGGSVTNLSTGTISGGGVYEGIKSVAGTVTNSGKILGDSVYGGVFLAKGGTVTNLAGTIAANGAAYGIQITGGAGTVTNAATIAASSAGGNAIILTSGFANRVIDQTGGVFIGTVNGGSAATMELASTASAGTLTATGDQFTNFSTLTIDSGADWTIKGDSTLSTEFAKIGGFTVGDTISLTGLAQTPTTFASSVSTISGTIQTAVTIKAGSTGLETLTLLGSIASSAFTFVAGTTSTLTEPASAPVVTAGGTVTFNGGSAAVVADSGLTVTDSGSSTLASATVSIGGFITGDTLTVGTPGGLTTGFSNGTLTLTGSASLATYETALDSVDYGFAANDDPTGGGSHTSRTLSWSVNDGTTASNTGTSTVETVHTAPTVVAGASVTFVQGGSAVTLDPGLTVTDPDSGGVLQTATISVAGGVFSTDGDTLSADTSGTGFGATYTQSDETLVLTGENASLSVWQTVLDSVALNSTGATAGARTIDWTVNDGVDNSATVTSTATVHDAPTIAASGTVTFNGGGSAVTADSGLTVTDVSSSTLASAKVVIGGFISGDTLNFSTQNGISESSFSSGTLSLSGVATLAQYQTALESITYGFTAGDDPTGGGSHTSRTLSWSVNDGTVGSNTGTSTVDTVHTAPTVTAGGTVTFDGGGGAVALDPGLAVTDVDSGGVLSSATVTVAGAITGDTLNFTNSHPSTEGNVAVASDSDGVLVLTSAGSTATVLQWETALESVTYSFTPSNGDPTGGGGNTSRTIDWSVNDGVANSATSASTLDTVHVGPTVIAGASVNYVAGGAAVVLDSGLTASDPDSGGNLTAATVTISSGFTTGDTLNFTNQNGITESGFSNGTLTLTGTSSIANYETALESVTYSSSSADPAVNNTDTSRTITWVVNDGVDPISGPTSTVHVDTPPSVTSIDTVGGSPNNASSDQFNVVFSEAVTGVSTTSFSLAETNTIAGTISSVSGSGTTYTVTVGSVTGDGTLGLNLKGSSTGITDAAGNAPTAGFTSGQTYTIEHTPPSVSSIDTVGSSSNSGGTDQFTVDFSESVTGVTASDFALTDTGSVTGTIASISGSGSSYTVTVTGATGTGTMRLDLKSSGTSIEDAAGNAISGGFTGGESFTISPSSGTPSISAPGTATVGVGQAGSVGTVTIAESPTSGGETFTLTVFDNNGTLTANTGAIGGGGTITPSNGGETLTISNATLAQVNADLTTLTDTEPTTASDTISYGLSDSNSGTANPASTTLTVNGVPTISAPGSANVTQNSAGAVGTITIGETGNTTTSGETFSAVVSDGAGVLSANTGATNGGGSITPSGGGTTLTFAGTLSQVNADLTTLADDDASTSADTITVHASDSFGNSDATDASIPVTVSAAATATFDAHVYLDTNADGVQDGSEFGLAGVTVNLLNGSGSPTGQVETTNASGNVSFTGLALGAYEIAVVTPAGDAVTQATNVNTPDTLTANETANATEGVYSPPALSQATIDLTVAQGQSLGNLWSELIANGVDPNPGSLSIVSVGTTGTQGSVSLSTRTDSLTYIATGFNPSSPVDAFTYTLEDGGGGTVTGTVDVTVTGPNLPTTVAITNGSTTTATGSGQRLISQGTGQTLDGSSAGGDQLFGGPDTSINAQGSGNTIYVEPGNHTINMGANNNTLTLNNGNNTVLATGTGDTVNGGNGNDSISGMTGTATITLGNGNDTVTVSGAGNNISVGTGTDKITAGNGGVETVVAGNGANTISGGGTGDSFTAGTGVNKITATGADATIVAGSGANTDGADTVVASGAGDQITTGGGNDSITVTAGSATIKAGLGSNTIKFAGSGNDVINQGGTDTLTDTGTDNTIVLPLAGQGMDTINGSVLSNGDTFDLRDALAATTWDQQLSDLGDYLTMGTSGSNTLVQLSTTFGGTPITIAVLNGQGSVSLSSFVTHTLLT